MACVDAGVSWAIKRQEDRLDLSEVAVRYRRTIVGHTEIPVEENRTVPAAAHLVYSGHFGDSVHDQVRNSDDWKRHFWAPCRATAV